MSGMPKEPLLTRSFLLAALAHFMHCMAFNLYLHLPGFLKDRGASEVEIGLIFGLTAATAIAARPSMGRTMDRHGRCVLILAGGMLHVLVCVLYLTVTRIGPWAYGVRVLHGVAEAAIFASLFAFAADVVPASRRIQGIALFGVSGMLPMSLSGLLGDVILAHAGYRELFAVSAVFAILGLVSSWPLVDAPRTGGEPSRGVLAAARQRNLVTLWGVGLCFATAISAYFTFMKTFVLTTHVGTVGLFFSAYSIAAVGLRTLGGSIPDRVGPRRALLPSLAMLVAGLLVLARANSDLAIGVAGTLCGLGHGFTFPILLGLVVHRSRPNDRGASMALFTALFDGGTLIGGPLLGATIRVAGYGAMFTTAAALVTLGAAGFYAFDRD